MAIKLEAVNEVVTVDEVAEGKYGWYAKVEDKFYNAGKYFKGIKDMKAGNTYELETVTTERGSKYINKLIRMVQDTPAPVAETKTVTTGIVAPAKAAVKGRDFDAEARGKTRCACITAAAQAPLTAQLLAGGSVEDALIIMRQLADAMYAYSFQEDK